MEKNMELARTRTDLSEPKPRNCRLTGTQTRPLSFNSLTEPKTKCHSSFLKLECMRFLLKFVCSKRYY